jgi:hypothetical protein
MCEIVVVSDRGRDERAFQFCTRDLQLFSLRHSYFLLCVLSVCAGIIKRNDGRREENRNAEEKIAHGVGSLFCDE